MTNKEAAGVLSEMTVWFDNQRKAKELAVKALESIDGMEAVAAVRREGDIQWIPPAVATPSLKSPDVLVQIIVPGMHGSHRICIGRWAEDGWHIEGTGMDAGYTVAAWMPLPKPADKEWLNEMVRLHGV